MHEISGDGSLFLCLVYLNLFTLCKEKNVFFFLNFSLLNINRVTGSCREHRAVLRTLRPVSPDVSRVARARRSGGRRRPLPPAAAGLFFPIILSSQKCAVQRLVSETGTEVTWKDTCSASRIGVLFPGPRLRVLC